MEKITIECGTYKTYEIQIKPKYDATVIEIPDPCIVTIAPSETPSVKEEPLNQILRELEKTNGILYALLLVHGIDVGSVLDQEPTGIRELARYALRQKNLAKGIDWPHLQSEEALGGKTLPTLKGLAVCLEESDRKARKIAQEGASNEATNSQL